MTNCNLKQWIKSNKILKANITKINGEKNQKATDELNMQDYIYQ